MASQPDAAETLCEIQRALDELRIVLVKVDALARAAEERTADMPWVADRDRRRDLQQLELFVVATAEASVIALDSLDAVRELADKGAYSTVQPRSSKRPPKSQSRTR